MSWFYTNSFFIFYHSTDSPILLESFACPTSLVLTTGKCSGIYSFTSSNSSSTENSFSIFVKVPINNPEILSKTPICFNCARCVANPSIEVPNPSINRILFSTSGKYLVPANFRKHPNISPDYFTFHTTTL